MEWFQEVQTTKHLSPYVSFQLIIYILKGDR